MGFHKLVAENPGDETKTMAETDLNLWLEGHKRKKMNR